MRNHGSKSMEKKNLLLWETMAGLKFLHLVNATFKDDSISLYRDDGLALRQQKAPCQMDIFR